MKVSIVTATYNSMACLPQLVDSLRSQTDADFEWVVADGGSTDGTLNYLRSINDLTVRVIQGPDFGIYDALNKAIKICEGDYYVTVGSDDLLYPSAVSQYKTEILKCSSVDMITCPVEYDGRIYYPKGKWSWLYGQFTFISAHSVGVLIKKDLHYRFGYYSRKYPIAADQFFILKAISNGAILKEGRSIVGLHGSEGVSGVDHLGVITEFFRVQVEVGRNIFLQTVICCLRLVKNILR
ncbi:glycosyltransferase [Marinobacter sp. 1Y8]